MMKILITNILMYYLVYLFRNVVTLHLINIMMQNSESVSIQDKLKFITLFAERLGVISPISSALCRGVSRFAESRCGVTRRTNAATRRLVHINDSREPMIIFAFTALGVHIHSFITMGAKLNQQCKG